MNATEKLAELLRRHNIKTANVVDLDPQNDRLYQLDFTAANIELSEELIGDTEAFSLWVYKKLADNRCRYGIGGYMEHRTIYSRSSHFDTGGEPRRLHLGTDIWGSAGIPIYATLDGTVHSFADNDNHGDYGPTIILQHRIGDTDLYALYGHLSRNSLDGLEIGKTVLAGQQIATLGNAAENGHWPPHLHFQLMLDVGEAKGDYPGVARYSEKDQWLQNIPDAALLLKLPRPVNAQGFL